MIRLIHSLRCPLCSLVCLEVYILQERLSLLMEINLKHSLQYLSLVRVPFYMISLMVLLLKRMFEEM
nr:MAG TPA: hypothetical protein [Caudoviricetes sp.]